MTTSEGELVACGYWRCNAIGMPVPGFVAVLLDEDSDLARGRWKRFYHRLFQRPPGDGAFLPFALEAAHRQRPITRLYQLRQTLNKIRQPGYDLVPARAIEMAYSAAREMINRHPSVGCPLASPTKAPLAKVLAAKPLPAGAAANLALMRATLSMPSRAGS